MDPTVNAIPKEIANALCEEIRAKYRGKWWTAAGLQCWGCTTFSKGNVEMMCVNNGPGNRGCNLVNARYDHDRDINHT